jgi:hypothetical protein
MTARKDEKKLLTRDASIDCTKNRPANEQVKNSSGKVFGAGVRTKLIERKA